jgi:CTP synthase (UTP-ammonia lyase)
VSSETWDAFIKQRKSKKAQITELVLKGIKTEADKAGWSMESALKEVVIRNWQSFKADWVKDSKMTATGEMNKKVISGLTRGLIGGGTNVKFIDN